MKFQSIFLCVLLLFACSKERKSNRAGHKMQDFIHDFSAYAKGINPNFMIVPQNGCELLYADLDNAEEMYDYVMNSIDGIGIEELFFNGTADVDNYTLDMLLQVKSRIPVFVSDFTSNQTNYNLSKTYNTDAGFIPFVRDSSNYDYIKIPPNPQNENASNITKLSEAKNYLYLISQDGFSSKTAFLDAIRNTNYDVVLIDAFYGDALFTNAEINSLKTKLNGGKRLVLSYISVGSAEKYRYYWKDDWKVNSPKWLAKPYDGYEDEVWVKYWKKDWQEIIYGNDDSYAKKILDAGFDGAYLDNVEAYYFLYFDE